MSHSLPGGGGDDEPIVSVIIAAFNPGGLIKEAIESALNQTRRDLEIIVIDDGSTEDLNQYLEPHKSQIRLVRLPANMGPAAARNAGIRESSGKYIAVLDSDDVWLPRRMEKVVEYLDSNGEIGFATTDSYLLIEGRTTKRSWFATAGTAFRDDDQHSYIFESNFLSGLVVYRRELFDRHGGYDESLRIGEDWDRHIAFLTGGERAGMVREPLSYYRVHPGNTTSDQRSLAVARVKVLEKWFRRDLRPEVRKALRRALGRADWDVLKMDVLMGHRPSLRQALAAVAGSRADVKLKAVSWGLMPGLIRRIHSGRLRFLAERGGAFSLAEAVLELRDDNLAEARKHLQAVVVFGHPMRVRLLALVWLSIPFSRKIVARRLLADDYVRSLLGNRP